MSESTVADESSRRAGMPLLTVAIPVFNAGKYLRVAVLSIVHQTFQDWELLIIDDGSSDDSLETIRDIDDARIRVFRDGENHGLATRLNEAVDLARGKYFARMDQDDFSYPERFASQLSFLRSHQGIDLVAVRAVTISEDDEVSGILPSRLQHDEICARPWLGFYLPHPTWLGHRDWFLKHRYTSPGPYFCEDQDLLLRSYATSRFATVNQVLFGYRLRSRINLRKQLKTRWTLYRIQQDHFYSAGLYKYALLSSLAFAGRVGSDLFRFAKEKLAGKASHSPVIDPEESSRWRRVSGQTGCKS
jgi:glycosyltransferase involved in cell wall biosynthesis